MLLIEKEIVVMNRAGLHARPAALFVKTANKFNSRITVIRRDEAVDGKSIFGILMLGATQGIPLTIKAEGDDAGIAIEELEKLLTQEQDIL